MMTENFDILRETSNFMTTYRLNGQNRGDQMNDWLFQNGDKSPTRLDGRHF